MRFVWCEKYSYVAMGKGWAGVHASFPWFDAYDVPLGAPLGPMTVVDAELGVFTRDFEHARVRVNVSAWSGSVEPKSARPTARRGSAAAGH